MERKCAHCLAPMQSYDVYCTPCQTVKLLEEHSFQAKLARAANGPTIPTGTVVIGCAMALSFLSSLVFGFNDKVMLISAIIGGALGLIFNRIIANAIILVFGLGIVALAIFIIAMILLR